jgi:predicted TIM-barrel fold metal-dependent hydrolase
MLIDCDVHNHIEPADILKRLPERWRRHLDRYGLRPSTHVNFVRPRAKASMIDSWPPSGGPPGSDRGFMTGQLLDSWQVDYALLNPMEQLSFASQPGDFAAALDRALNEALLEDWLDPEPRFYGGFSVPYEDSALAVKELERLGSHPRFSHVYFGNITSKPLGNPGYWPVYEAAQHLDLPVLLHVAGWSGHQRTACGWPSFYAEDHGLLAHAFVDHVISLIAEGVFDRFPRLRIVLAEGGFAWMPSLMWRMDRSYHLLRDDLPSLQRLPSEYVRQHFWFTTQPIEEPEKPEFLMPTLESLGMDDRFLFATDYPHWDFDAPDRVFPRGVPERLKQMMYYENALQAFSRLPGRRSASDLGTPG